jgi:hypothetical protein
MKFNQKYLLKIQFKNLVKKLKFKARRHGLVGRVKIHVQEIVSSNPGPAVETIYHAPLIWIKSMKAKIVEK